MTLAELNGIVSGLVEVEETSGVWVTAEISDFSVRRHAYLELVQKDEGGNTVAKARATIWAATFHSLDSRFLHATGSHMSAGQKVMFLVSATFHPAYGFALNVTDVNPAFTMGDMLLRRAESIARLEKEGIIDMNRTLCWSGTPMRLAVISSESAAGYGDFMNQLHGNPRGLKFMTTLYPAVMQGTSAPASIIAALDGIAADADRYDGVVIIRGGGASDDLSCFEDYTLAANIAQFPLPVIIGIGHERDVTLLDYVANMRVKTPTAAAAWLIERASCALDALLTLGDAVLRRASEIISLEKARLERSGMLLRKNSDYALRSAKSRLELVCSRAEGLARTKVESQKNTLEHLRRQLESLASAALLSARRGLDSRATLLDAISPEATLRRGYTMTLHDGKAAFDPDSLGPGDTITTIFKNGKSLSTKL